MDVDLLRSTWKTAQDLGDAVPLRFYSTLFYEHPETRGMFPPAMNWSSRGLPGQRDKLVYAIGQAVGQVDDLERLRPVLRMLGADHRRFGVTPEAYDWVGSALLQTLADFFREGFTEAVATSWAEAYAVLAEEMKAGAAEQEAAGIPPWWDAVIAYTSRTPYRVTLTIDTHQSHPPTGYADLPAGRTIHVRHPHRPGLWTIANVTDQDMGHWELDVQVDHSGDLDLAGISIARIHPGATLRIGAPWDALTALPKETAPDE